MNELYAGFICFAIGFLFGYVFADNQSMPTVQAFYLTDDYPLPRSSNCNCKKHYLNEEIKVNNMKEEKTKLQLQHFHNNQR